MKSAAEILFDIIVASGMTEDEAYALMMRYLEEEAEVYVECMETFIDRQLKKEKRSIIN